MELYTVFLLVLLSCVSLSAQQKPVYKCELSGTTCTFKNVILNSTHFEWQPASDTPNVVTDVKFTGSIIPVVTKGLCELFPSLNSLSLGNLEISRIEQDAFKSCFNLTFINLENNRIRDLDDGLFANIPNLEGLYLLVNNLTRFSPELVRNNRNLKAALLQTNDLSDVDVETIVKEHPFLEAFTVTDNEIHCTRYVEIVNMLRSKGIQVPGGYKLKQRYYETVVVFENSQNCVPDVAWMAANYRKENSITDKVLKQNKLENQLIANQKDIQDSRALVDQRLSQIEEKLAKIDDLNLQIQKLVALLSELKTSD